MPRADLLETFANPYEGRDYEIHMTCDEFTSLCPLGGVESDAAELDLLKGGAPDFGTIHITYTPGAACLELKSLKLFLNGFRDQCVSHESVTNLIFDTLAKNLKPRTLEVVGDFNVRGNVKTVVRVAL